MVHLQYIYHPARGSWCGRRRRSPRSCCTRSTPVGCRGTGRHISTTVGSSSTVGIARTNDLFHDGVETGTVGTLDAQKVPVAILTARLAIVAHDVHNTGQIGGHGLHLDVPGAGGPRGRHGLLTNDGLLADGAAVVEPGQLAEAVGVDGVTTGQILGRLAGGKHVLAADGTVVPEIKLELFGWR